MVQPNKAIVGANAFAHEAGIHQDGMLKNPMTYEIMRPETIGLSKTQLVLGKHSGRHALRNRLKELGYELSEEELDTIFTKFKDLARQEKACRRRRPGNHGDRGHPAHLGSLPAQLSACDRRHHRAAHGQRGAGPSTAARPGMPVMATVPSMRPSTASLK